MHHHTPIIRAMPMRRPGLTNNHISRANPPGLPTFVANPATPSLDFENLPAFVRVPECAGAGEEGDVVAHDSGGGVDVDYIHVDVAGESGGGLFGGGVGGYCCGGGGGDYG